MNELKGLSPNDTKIVLRKMMAENGLKEFVRQGWKYMDPSVYSPSWAIDAVCEHLQAVSDGKIRNLLINIPPRMGKSSLSSVAWPAWMWAQRKIGALKGPQVQIMSSSYAATLSERDSTKMRRLISSEWYQSNWGANFKMVGDQNTKRKFENDKGGYRLATSVTGTQTGDGGNCHPKGTRILTDKGYLPIEELQIGTKVLSYDFNLQRLVYSDIIASSTREEEKIYEIHTLKGYTVRCTAEHPIYVEAKGFIPASELRVGDRLRITDRPQDNDSSDVRLLWVRPSEAFIRYQESLKGKQCGQLLFDGMQEQPSCGKKQQQLHSLWKAAKAQKNSILFGCLQGYSKTIEKAQAYLKMLRMWEVNIQNLLRKGLCQYSAFQANGWGKEFQLCGDGLLFESIPENATFNSGKRQSRVRELPAERESNGGEERTDESSYSSYGRGHEEQSTKQSSDDVQFLSYEAPQWGTDYIESITFNSERPGCVYDIQVARTNNFFAEGILVHNCLIVDDPISANDANSELERQNVIRWWTETMPTRLNDPIHGARVVIMQRLHEDDLSGYILEHNEFGEWEHLMLPMRYEPRTHCSTSIGWEDPRLMEGELLCPNRFDENSVQTLERSLGSFTAAGQLGQTPIVKGGGIIKDDWWQIYPPMEWNLKDAEYPPFEFILMSCDTAYTDKQENDFSACTVWGVWRYREVSKILLMDAWQERLSFHELTEKIIKTARSNKIDKLLIEAKASGLSVVQELKRLCAGEDFSIEAVLPKGDGLRNDKVSRVYPLQPLFENGTIYAPEAKFSDMVIQQFSAFPKGKHDDLCDSSSQALNWMRRAGIAQLSGESRQQTMDEQAYRSPAVQINELYGV